MTLPVTSLDYPTQLAADLCPVAAAHLNDPLRPATDLANACNVPLDAVRSAYRSVRANPQVRNHLQSLYYPHRHRVASAGRTIALWLAEPDRLRRLLAGEPVVSHTVELHASKGTCTYRCQMCLWSDQEQLTYIRRGLRSDGLLTTDEWFGVLDDLQAHGVNTVVLSGGGEVLLNQALPTILQHARDLNLACQLYTTGYHLPHTDLDHPLWDEAARLERVRFSIHSPFAVTYDTITQLPARLHAFERVTANLQQLIEHRNRLDTGGEIGIGFVTQTDNVDELEAMASYAAGVGADFLELRKDEVDVTDVLSPAQIERLASQLNIVRQHAEAGDYGHLQIDLADELVAIANRQTIDRRRTPECLAKYFRPTISPYGIVAPCDLIAEPRFANQHLTIGNARQGMKRTLDQMADTTIPDTCEQCMPSSRTGNAVHHKLLADLRSGVGLEEQPFLPPTATAYNLAP